MWIKITIVMSFHQCRGNIGDIVNIPLPKWVLEVGEKDPDIFYTNPAGNLDEEYLTLGVDNLPLFAGRTTVEGRSQDSILRGSMNFWSLFPVFEHLQPHSVRHTVPQIHQTCQGQTSTSTTVTVPHPPNMLPRVQARRGQATDPHSIAEWLRRERIAERMRALHELVPSCNKTDKAVMLDEILDYVKFLRLQVKVVYMKSFRESMADFLEAEILTDIEVGLGPAGELRYPSYPETQGCVFPGIGEFQSYDKYLKSDIKEAATIEGHPEWAFPDNEGKYNDTPGESSLDRKGT